MKKIISYFLAILLAVFLIATIFILITSNTVLNENFILKLLDENHYYELLSTSIKSGIEEYIQQSGLDNDVFENIYTEENLKQDVKTIITNTYNNTETEINANVVKDNLRRNIDNYLNENNVTLSRQEQKNIDDFVEEVGEVYEKEISHPVYLDTAQKVIIRAKKVISQYGRYVYIAALVSAILILVINIKSIRDVLKYFAISLLTSAFFIIIGITLIRVRVNIDNLLILNSSFTLLITNGIKKIIQKFMYTGAGFTLFATVFIPFTLKNSKNTQKNVKTIAKHMQNSV